MRFNTALIYCFYGALFLAQMSHARENLFPKVVNDSCAMGVHVQNCQFQYCDNGIFLANPETQECLKIYSKNLKEEVSSDSPGKKLYSVSFEYWSELVQKNFLVKSKENAPSKKCALAFYLSEEQFVKCGAEYFFRAKGSGSYVKTDDQSWERAARQLPSAKNSNSSEEAVDASPSFKHKAN